MPLKRCGMNKNIFLMKRYWFVFVPIIFGGLGFFLCFYLSQETSKNIEIKEEPNEEKLLNEESVADRQKIVKENTEKVAEDNPVETKKLGEEKREVEKPGEVLEEKEAPSLSVKNNLVSWGYQKATAREIDTIVIHTSYDAIGDNPFSVTGILNEYEEYGVSAHYLISREGKIYRLVEDKNIAYHAGESQVPDGRTGVNAFSIGIELVNTKTDKCTSDQYIALENLLIYLKDQYKIKYVLGHNEIASGRKDDPWGFSWSKVR